MDLLRLENEYAERVAFGWEGKAAAEAVRGLGRLVLPILVHGF